MKFLFILFLLQILSFLNIAQKSDETPLADVNLVPARQYKMQKQDMQRIKDILETEIKQEIKSIEEKWSENERLKERQYGMMNMPTQFNPTPGNSPPFPTYLYPMPKKEKEEKETKTNKKAEEKNEKLTDQLAKELYVVNSAIDQLKNSIDQSTRTLKQPITKFVNTIIHSPTEEKMTKPRFKSDDENIIKENNDNNQNVTETEILNDKIEDNKIIDSNVLENNDNITNNIIEENRDVKLGQKFLAKNIHIQKEPIKNVNTKENTINNNDINKNNIIENSNIKTSYKIEEKANLNNNKKNGALKTSKHYINQIY